MARYDFQLQRLHVADDLASGHEIKPDTRQTHYLINVLRMRAGGEVLLFNGRDGEWRAEISSLAKRSCTLRLVEQTRAQTMPGEVSYLFAPLKKARLDYMVQKATEMGASALGPVLTTRTNAERVNTDRMRANVVEAAEQCGILSVPVVHEPKKLMDCIAGWTCDRPLIVCDEDAPASDPITALKAVPPGPVALLVGPEGGFAPEERDMMRRQSFVTRISLGPRILRADTAAVAGLTLIQAILGDLAR